MNGCTGASCLAFGSPKHISFCSPSTKQRISSQLEAEDADAVLQPSDGGRLPSPGTFPLQTHVLIFSFQHQNQPAAAGVGSFSL